MASKRIPLVAGNWKMNFDHLEATYFVQKLVWLLRDAHFDFKRCEVALFPLVHVIAQRAGAGRSRQAPCRLRRTIRFRDHPRCLHRRCVRGHDRPSCCSYVIVGHSERRKYHPEDDANIVDQVRAVLAAGMQPILCVGESFEERRQGIELDFAVGRYETSPAISTKNKPPNSSWPTNLSGPLAPAWWPLRNPPRMPQTPSATI